MGHPIAHHEAALKITSEIFDHESAAGVQHQVNQKKLTLKPAPAAKNKQEDHHEHDEPRFIQLSRVKRCMQRISEATLMGKRDPERRIRWQPVAAPRQKAANSSECMHKTSGDRHNIEHGVGW